MDTLVALSHDLDPSNMGVDNGQQIQYVVILKPRSQFRDQHFGNIQNSTLQ
jgi:hypothetical protein